MTSEKLKVISLGGLGEIGKNMTVLEYQNDIIIIDCGIAFPDDELLGVDLVIPDITYLKRKKSKIKGIVITHGHEDHIGALPYFLKEINVPIYCTRLTAGIIETKLQEHKIAGKVRIINRKAGDRFSLGCFGIEFIRVNHSIADSVALAINTPVGMVVHTGDFKIDMTPVNGEMTDLTRFGELGNKGVLLLLGESTNVVRPGFSMSEKKVGEAFDAQFKNCDRRIIIASFASNIDRMQQIINVAAKYNRKVAISGRSMENVMNVALNLGYIKLPKDILIGLEDLNKYPKNKIVIITTGSQGEPMSALHRIAFSLHKQIDVIPGDKIIIAAQPIPGNEKSVYKLINELMRRGADVVYERMAEVHASGHACREELKIMLSLVHPKFFMPIHGEYRHLKENAALGVQMGVNQKNIFINEIGRVLEVTANSARLGATVPSGRVLVDGLGVGDVGAPILSERKRLSEDGLVIVSVAVDMDGRIVCGPEVSTRGFVFSKDAADLMNELKNVAVQSVERCARRKKNDITALKAAIRDDIAGFLYKKCRRSPMVVPIIMQV